MDKLTRRNLLRALAAGVGTVVIARTPLANAHTAPADDPNHTEIDVRARAAKLDQSDSESPNDVYAQFRNVFRNGGGFRNGGFRNGFLNGGFRNGGFRNGGFRNGGFRNGGFRNGGFRNAGGGFRNVFRNF